MWLSCTRDGLGGDNELYLPVWPTRDVAPWTTSLGKTSDPDTEGSPQEEKDSRKVSVSHTAVSGPRYSSEEVFVFIRL